MTLNFSYKSVFLVVFSVAVWQAIAKYEFFLSRAFISPRGNHRREHHANRIRLIKCELTSLLTITHEFYCFIYCYNGWWMMMMGYIWMNGIFLSSHAVVFVVVNFNARQNSVCVLAKSCLYWLQDLFLSDEMFKARKKPYIFPRPFECVYWI